MPDMNSEGVSLLSTTAIADFSAVADTAIYTVPVAKLTIPVIAFVKVDGDIGAALVCSIGQAGAETDWIGATNGDNLDAANDVIPLMPVPSATPATMKAYTAGTVIEFRISVGGNAVAGKVFFLGFNYDA